MAKDRVALSLEAFARTVDRRAFLRRTFQVGFASAVGLTTGSFGFASQVLAFHCQPCNYPYGRTCNSLGYACPGGNGWSCPSGCSICGPECPPPQYECIYDDGWWYACGCGTCHLGCYRCYDCKCPSSAGCTAACGCRSNVCECCNCCSPQDLAEERRRLASAA